MTASSLSRQAAWLNTHRRGPLGGIVMFTDDDRLADPRPYLNRLPRGGSVILRSKQAIDFGFAHSVLTETQSRQLNLLIAGDPHLAYQIGANGVHLPSKMLHQLPVLKRIYPRFVISAACHNGRELRLAINGGADAAFLSPLFATRSHGGTRPLSFMQARQMLHGIDMPVYGLGGINEKTAQRLIAMPLCGFGVIDGLLP